MKAVIKSRFALLMLVACPAAAQVSPQPGEGDPRIQSVDYSPTQIIRLSVAPGLQTMVELGAGEMIQTIGVGDSAAWQVSAGKRGDFFFVKNISASAATNMTVVTAGRVYNFELSPAGGYGEVNPYHVKLVYPGRSRVTATVDVERSYSYSISGSRAIRPSSVVQDGMRTVIEWPADMALPAIFMLDNGNEALVNGEMQDGQFVIAGNPEKLVFRLDRKTAYATRKTIPATQE
jgi:type IV secretion system protein VirB9